MESGFFKERVATVQETISRSRFVFLVSNLATVIVLTGLFNLYLSWIRFMIPRRVEPQYEQVLQDLAKARVEDTTMISVPFVCLRIFCGDIGLVAGMGMFILSVWLYFAFRKEQHAVAGLVLELTTTGADGIDRVPSDRCEHARFALPVEEGLPQQGTHFALAGGQDEFVAAASSRSSSRRSRLALDREMHFNARVSPQRSRTRQR